MRVRCPRCGRYGQLIAIFDDEGEIEQFVVDHGGLGHKFSKGSKHYRRLYKLYNMNAVSGESSYILKMLSRLRQKGVERISLNDFKKMIQEEAERKTNKISIGKILEICVENGCRIEF